MNKLLEFKNGYNAPKDDYGSGTKFINVSDILENDFLINDNIEDSVEISEKKLKENLVEYGDILFQRSSETREEVGTANVYLDEIPCTFGGFVIRGKKINDYEPYFMKNLLNSQIVRKEITSWSGGSTRYNIGQESLNKITVLMPSIKEQEKISELFLLLNKKISSMEKNEEQQVMQVV